MATYLLHGQTRVFFGATKVELVRNLPAAVARISMPERRCVIHGKLDSVKLSWEYTYEEGVQALADRALLVLCRDHGFKLYKEVAS